MGQKIYTLICVFNILGVIGLTLLGVKKFFKRIIKVISAKLNKAENKASIKEFIAITQIHTFN